MGWVKIDDAYTHHPKVVAAGIDALALDVGGMCYAAAHLTDGFIPDAAVPMLAPTTRAKKAAAELVKVGRWERDDERGGYWVHDYLKYNPTAEKVLTEREDTKRRVDAHRESRRNSKRNGRRNSVTPTATEAATPPDTNGGGTAVPSPNPLVNQSSSEEPLGAEPSDDDDRLRQLAEADLTLREAELGSVGDRQAWLAGAVRRRREAGDFEPRQPRQATVDAPPAAAQPPEFETPEGHPDYDLGRAELARIRANSGGR